MTDTTTRPLVIVIENPDEDPIVLVAGDVEVISCSSYPTTGYCSGTERDAYATYPADMRAIAERCRQAGNDEAAKVLDGLAARFEARGNE